MLACGGTAFTSTDNGGGGSGGNSAGGSQTAGGASNNGGSLSHGGSSVGGSVVGSGGKQGKAGSVGVAGIAGDVTRGGDVSVGGDVTLGGSVAIGGDNASAGAGPDPIDKSCPAALPTTGKGCAAGLSCSYGDDIRPSCHSRALCKDGAWGIELPKCMAINACPPIVQGNPCDPQSPSCTIQDSIFCTCTGCTGAGPCSTDTVWQCASVSGPQACPQLVPNEGQACTGNSACSYGSCTTGEKLTATCNGATWGWQPFSCPQ